MSFESQVLEKVQGSLRAQSSQSYESPFYKNEKLQKQKIFNSILLSAFSPRAPCSRLTVCVYV